MDCNRLPGSTRLWPALVGAGVLAGPVTGPPPPHRLAGENAGAPRGKPWPPRHLPLLMAPVEPASGGTVPRVALAGATTAPGYPGTDDLTVTGRDPPADRWRRSRRQGRPAGRTRPRPRRWPRAAGVVRLPAPEHGLGKAGHWLTPPPASAGPPGVGASPTGHRRPVGGDYAAGHPRAPAGEEHGLATIPAPTRFSGGRRWRYEPGRRPRGRGVGRLARRGSRYRG